MTKQLFIKLVYIVLLGIFFISCKSKSSEKKKSAKQNIAGLIVDGYVVKPSKLEQTIVISGTLRPSEETVLMPEVAGRVISVFLPEGKFVRKGTLLVKLFDGDLQAQLKKSQAQLLIAELMQKRQSELIKVSGISQAEYDQTLLQINSIKADIEIYKVQIGKTELLAPFDGVIGLKNISPGAQVTTSTALATIRAVEQLKLDFSVPEKYSSEIQQGKKIKFTIQGNETKFDATVFATEQGIDFNTRNLKVRAFVDSKTNLLTPGKYATVELRLSEKDSAIMVPTQAIIPQDRDKRVIVSKGGKAQMIVVKTGVRKEASIEILSGLNIGDTIAITGLLFLKQGDLIRFSKAFK